MSQTDARIDFFFRHWEALEEWWPLYTRAAEALDAALAEAVLRLDRIDPDLVELNRGSTTYARLRLREHRADAWIELQWNRTKLLRGDWPRLLIVWNKNSDRAGLFDTVRRASTPAAGEIGMKPGGSDWWVWSLLLRPDTGAQIDPDTYAELCAQRLAELWELAKQPLEDALGMV